MYRGGKQPWSAGQRWQRQLHRALQPTISNTCIPQRGWWCHLCPARLTKMVVTISVRLAKESVMLVDRSLLLSVMLRPLYEFQTPICAEESR